MHQPASRHPAAGLLLCVLLAGFLPAQGTWVETPVPVDPSWRTTFLHDVTAVGPSNAWAVGHYDQLTVPPYGYETFSLAMHWDGTSWQQQPTPSPSLYTGGTNVRLYAVEAAAPDDVWAGGAARGYAGGLSVGDWIHVQRFDGSTWSVVTPPQPPGGTTVNFSGTRIRAIEAIAADDIWFGGFWGSTNALASVDWHPLAMHWDGSNLSLHPTPVVWDSGYGFGSVSLSALATDDVWACCQKNTAGGYSTFNVIIHWDGSQWTRMPVPDSSMVHTLHAIEAVAPDDVWVFGRVQWTGAPYILHYNGSGWTEITSGPMAHAALSLGPGQLFAAGGAISLYDGSSWSTVAGFPQVSAPNFRAMAADSSGGLWAAGTQLAPGIRPFVVRHSPLTMASATTRTGCSFPAPPGSLQAPAPPVLGQTFQALSGDPTDAAGLTPGTTQSYLFVAAQPAPLHPCGSGLPGLGTGGGSGELLININPSSLLLMDGPVAWNGPGLPASHLLPVPQVPGLEGATVHLQALLLDTAGPSVPGIVTDALELRLGY